MKSGKPTVAQYAKGYRLDKATLVLLSEEHQTNVVASAMAAISDLASIVALAILATHSLAINSLVLSLLVNVFALMVISRSLRALECLVHEGSHYNWSRNRKLNDSLTNLLAAFPVFTTVEAYRKPHLLHHNRFGSEIDPCHQRFKQLELCDRRNKLSFLLTVTTNLPDYLAGWWAAFGLSGRSIVWGILWHGLFLTALCLLSDLHIATALRYWMLYFLVPYVFCLPPLRLIAESEKHRYLSADSEFDATISNIGILQRLLLHPHGDGYHQLHHIDRSIPHHRLKRAHQLLLEKSQKFYRERHPNRIRVFMNPKFGFTRGKE